MIGNDDTEERQRQNLESLLETMDAIWKRYKDAVRKLDGYSGVHFSEPLCDMMLSALWQLEANEQLNNKP